MNAVTSDISLPSFLSDLGGSRRAGLEADFS